MILTHKSLIKRACFDIHTSRTYFPTSNDVGMYLALSWTPVRIDGKRGKALVTSSSAPVMPGKNLILHQFRYIQPVLVLCLQRNIHGICKELLLEKKEEFIIGVQGQ